MGMTRRGGVGAAFACALIVVACGGEDAPPEEEVTEEPVVMGSPSVLVAVGSDTLEVWSGTLFTYYPEAGGDGEPSLAIMEAGRELQETLKAGEAGLRALGVQVVPVGSVPIPLGIAPEAEAAAGPALTVGSSGYLLVHPRGRIRRFERSTSANDLVCAAARIMQVDPPAVDGLTCR